MQIFVKTLGGSTLVLDASPSDTVGFQKEKIQCEEGIPSNVQRLLYAGKQLDDDDLTLEECEIIGDSTLHLDLRLLGGGKKRKKKTYTGPKKQKHVRKKQKLAVLKLYKIGDNNEITRQRIECTSPSCGGGIFMAKHPDRHYCGKCHVTWAEKK
ncbi:ribosomal protein s27a domain-containing protein [Ditylenchus destructor]|uniref:Ribosomal protein s27a domain-containing protein n=1 Tax=Ditylenchus destructor TaxID=166010 RepID=A0AAD4NA57_9BILA|nr:ribosomal protein s27a domain-containing protein [Ditylenchus destructor]